MAGERDLARYIDVMLHDPDADVRRDTVAHVGNTRFLDDPDALHAVITVARTDQNPGVRCKALQVLGKSKHAMAVNNVVAVFTADDQPQPTDIVPTCDKVRWEAAKSLNLYMKRDELNQDQLAAIRDASVHHMRTDECRDVRITCAQLLGEDPHRRTVESLIGGLKQQDFAIAYEAEHSLRRLTGQSFGYDTMAWESWLNQVEDPLAEGEFARSNRKDTWWPFASR